jgi:two-component system, chemotaxis family, protein-glutamate methylesterase/glutaminase
MLELTDRKKVRVLIVEDSAFYRQALSAMLSTVDQIEIIGTARDGADAIMKVTRDHPDVITLDLEMPKVDGFVFLRWLVKHAPTAVLVVSSQSDQANVFKALELGALDFLAKPNPRATREIMEMKDELISKITAISSIPKDRLQLKATGAINRGHPRSFFVGKKRKSAKQIDLVAIGASTGGPSAVQSVVSYLPQEFPAAVTVAQHMPPGFTHHFAERLNKISPVPVSEARQGDVLETGRVYICPGGYHMTFERKRNGVYIHLEMKRDSDYFVPSVDKLFSSASDIYPGRVLGVILTGMGYDGKIGMRKIKKDGGQTIAESEETAVVFGMPKEAIEEGVVDKILPLSEICGEIVRRTSF